jgi:hypothetical protein
VLIVIIAISIIAIVVGAVIYYRFDEYEAGFPLLLVGIIVFFVFVIALIVCGAKLVRGKQIDEKIKIYEVENERIEQRVADSISAYLEHENKIFESASNILNPESAMTIVAAYPELNSSELIIQQITIYNENASLIKELKAKKIELAAYRWWVYFG